ncbi:MAG TPA: hypothetical protein VFE72_03070 [Lysobacter sp.]|nr:hypothetical protein [Lysobacter sp.]
MTFAPRHLAVLICRHVFEHSRPVLLVRNQEDTWSLLCGGEDHGDEDFCYVGVGHLLDRDPTLDACADLLQDHEAERSAVGGAWTRAVILVDES